MYPIQKENPTGKNFGVFLQATLKTTFQHSWQRAPNPPILWRPPYIPYPSLFQILTNPPPLPLQISTFTALFVALLLWLNGWSRHIWQGVPNSVKGEGGSPQVGGNRKFCCGRIFYRLGGNLKGSDFDNLNIFQS